jgi:ABC-type glutathione transport system ATPase component
VSLARTPSAHDYSFVPPAIETRALRKSYPAPPARRRGSGGTGPGADGAVLALDGLDLTIQPGEFFGLLGPNGAGKTTTIGILTTRVRATSGQAFVGGADVATHGELVRRRIGVVPQRPNPDRGLSVLENLLFHGAYFGLSRAFTAERSGSLLEQLGMSDKSDAKVDALSGGQQQRLMIARAAARAAGDLPRRADGRPRSAGAPGLLGNPARAAPGRPHHRDDDALYGRGRPAVRAAGHRGSWPAAGL